MATKNYAPCYECGELEDNKLHHDVANSMTKIEVCEVCVNQGEEHGWVPSMLCHEFEAGCYCADAGKCEVCVDQAMDYADHLRDAAKEA